MKRLMRRNPTLIRDMEFKSESGGEDIEEEI